MGPSDPERPDARGLSLKDLALVAAARIVASACALASGFRAVSDDDYARVVIAQQWAASPKLDPSGTSWLPFPFWLQGAAMLAFGRSLLVAQIVAFALGVASSLLIALAAFQITRDRRASVVAGCASSLVGWSAWLGVATVPELFTAALTLFAVSTLARSASGNVYTSSSKGGSGDVYTSASKGGSGDVYTMRLLGGVALIAATLSRYEPWPVAVGFAVWNLGLAVRGVRAGGLASVGRRGGASGLVATPASRSRAAGSGAGADRLGRLPERERQKEATASREASPPLRTEKEARTVAGALLAALPASVLALAGPALWIGWNHRAHGDALHFVARVTGYHAAVGGGSGESVFERVIAYPVAFAREMPEVLLPAGAMALLAFAPEARGFLLAALRRNGVPLLLALAQLMLLALALVKDGAPTHHPERATLFAALALVVFVTDAAFSANAAPPPASPPPVKLPRWAILAVAAGASAILLVRIVTVPRARPEGFAQRGSELAAGAFIASSIPPGARVWIEVTDYGYLALQARSGRPEDFTLDRDIDPRHPTEAPKFGSDAGYVDWLRARGAAYVVSPVKGAAAGKSEGGGAGRIAGEVKFTASRHVVWEVPR